MINDVAVRPVRVALPALHRTPLTPDVLVSVKSLGGVVFGCVTQASTRFDYVQVEVYNGPNAGSRWAGTVHEYLNMWGLADYKGAG